MLESKQRQGGERESDSLGSTCTDLALAHGIPLLLLHKPEAKTSRGPARVYDDC